jgi:hypothetical protein
MIGMLLGWAKFHLQITFLLFHCFHFFVRKGLLDIEKIPNRIDGFVTQKKCNASTGYIEKRSNIELVGNLDNFLDMLPGQGFDPQRVPDRHDIRQGFGSQRSRERTQRMILVLFQILGHF